MCQLLNLSRNSRHIRKPPVVLTACDLAVTFCSISNNPPSVIHKWNNAMKAILKYQEATREGREIRTKRKKGVISSTFTSVELKDFDGALVCPMGKSRKRQLSMRDPLSKSQPLARRLRASDRRRRSWGMIAGDPSPPSPRNSRNAAGQKRICLPERKIVLGSDFLQRNTIGECFRRTSRAEFHPLNTRSTIASTIFATNLLELHNFNPSPSSNDLDFITQEQLPKCPASEALLCRAHFSTHIFSPPLAPGRPVRGFLHLSHPVFGQNGRTFWITDVLHPSQNGQAFTCSPTRAPVAARVEWARFESAGRIAVNTTFRNEKTRWLS
ncbi:hypothetical protein CEXT_732871 [Caerostris extrusa]|uniref:Uncharacterized protein n=1 Tax=Caerostris extrusa TaxID=172846 RepID=A0AAV4R1Q4_CAEEX|nr:hypothetical protein CEXT_732871 [Caerostris extrusa]